MTCYLRHLKDVLDQAGVSPGDKTERRQVDQAIRDIVGIQQTGIKCPEIWKQVKAYLQEPQGQQELIRGLGQKLARK